MLSEKQGLHNIGFPCAFLPEDKGGGAYLQCLRLTNSFKIADRIFGEDYVH